MLFILPSVKCQRRLPLYAQVWQHVVSSDTVDAEGQLEQRESQPALDSSVRRGEFPQRTFRLRLSSYSRHTSKGDLAPLGALGVVLFTFSLRYWSRSSSLVRRQSERRSCVRCVVRISGVCRVPSSA